MPQVPETPPVPRGTLALTFERAPVPKDITWRSDKWLAAVRQVELCVLCGAHGVEPAHRNEGKGGAIKTHDCWTAALCRECHRGLDQGKDMPRDERRSRMDAAILLTLVQLARMGKVVAK